jgi:hypothetical protein
MPVSIKNRELAGPETFANRLAKLEDTLPCDGDDMGQAYRWMTDMMILQLDIARHMVNK